MLQLYGNLDGIIGGGSWCFALPSQGMRPVSKGGGLRTGHFEQRESEARDSVGAGPSVAYLDR